jgi:hypothetical protein
LTPPVTNTLPLSSKVAVWLRRGRIIDWAILEVPVAGSYNSTLLVVPPVLRIPPATNTWPLGSSVAVCELRATLSPPVLTHGAADAFSTATSATNNAVLDNNLDLAVVSIVRNGSDARQSFHQAINPNPDTVHTQQCVMRNQRLNQRVLQQKLLLVSSDVSCLGLPPSQLLLKGWKSIDTFVFHGF